MFTDEEHDKMKEILLNNNYPTSFRHVDVRIDRVVFADGLVWYKSYYFRRDPSDPKRFIRDRPSGKLEERKSIKPGLPQKPATLLHSKSKECPAEMNQNGGVFFWRCYFRNKHTVDEDGFAS
jgi:hypothetical protein